MYRFTSPFTGILVVRRTKRHTVPSGNTARLQYGRWTAIVFRALRCERTLSRAKSRRNSKTMSYSQPGASASRVVPLPAIASPKQQQLTPRRPAEQQQRLTPRQRKNVEEQQQQRRLSAPALPSSSSSRSSSTQRSPSKSPPQKVAGAVRGNGGGVVSSRRSPPGPLPDGGGCGGSGSGRIREKSNKAVADLKKQNLTKYVRDQQAFHRGENSTAFSFAALNRRVLQEPGNVPRPSATLLFAIHFRQFLPHSTTA
jgi:hypothetical protein